MKLTTSKKELLKLLERCNGVADKKSAIPVMANVMLTASTGEVRLSAMSLAQSVTGAVSAKVTKHGSILVSCATLLARVKSMPDGDLQLSLDKSEALVIKHASSARRFQLSTLPSDSFPEFPNPDDTAESVVVSANVLSSLILSTQSAVSTDDTRLALNCLLIEFRPGIIRCVGLDGHRMHKSEAVLDHQLANSDMLIPLVSVQQLRRIIDIGDKSVTIRTSGQRVFFDADGVRFEMKLINAQFPPWEQIIPSTCDGDITINRETIAEAVSAIGGSLEKDKGVKITIEDSSVTIEATSSDHGEGIDKLQCEGTGHTITGLNPKYVTDALSSIGGDSVTIRFTNDVVSPVSIVPTKKVEGFDILTLVQPMKV